MELVELVGAGAAGADPAAPDVGGGGRLSGVAFRLAGAVSARQGRGGQSSDDAGTDGGVVPQPVRDRDPARLRGLGGDVPALRAVRRGAARVRRGPALVLEL